MELGAFIEAYDKDGCIVLLEGKREVLSEDRPHLVRLGALLAASTTRMRFRSGNAKGADELFSSGVASVDRQRLQVVTPYAGHRKSRNQAGEVFNLGAIDLAAEPEVVYQTKTNKSLQGLVDRYVAGDRGSLAIRAAYLIRDTVKVIGAAGIPRAGFAIFYDDLSKPGEGGTGHTMAICRLNGLPYIDQRTWLGWLT